MGKRTQDEKSWVVKAAIRSPKSADELVEYIGKHLVAIPFSREGEIAGGQLISVDPETRTASLRRYDNDFVNVVPWLGTEFRYSVSIDNPFWDLKPGSKRRFEWFHDADGRETSTPRTLVGTVDLVKPELAHLWVRDDAYSAGGWWATIHAEDAAKHSLRAVNLKQDPA
ncbi:hypothetical protein ABZ281_02585 [Streptomyces sp. NPDC006265]|uniref:hypothetical protein n=1 Tax=Streptomyces sp. NPDC006265 TaxID=3156740 RepID=UPI0033A9A6D8